MIDVSSVIPSSAHPGVDDGGLDSATLHAPGLPDAPPGFDAWLRAAFGLAPALGDGSATDTDPDLGPSPDTAPAGLESAALPVLVSSVIVTQLQTPIAAPDEAAPLPGTVGPVIAPGRTDPPPGLRPRMRFGDQAFPATDEIPPPLDRGGGTLPEAPARPAADHTSELPELPAARIAVLPTSGDTSLAETGLPVPVGLPATSPSGPLAVSAPDEDSGDRTSRGSIAPLLSDGPSAADALLSAPQDPVGAPGNTLEPRGAPLGTMGDESVAEMRNFSQASPARRPERGHPSPTADTAAVAGAVDPSVSTEPRSAPAAPGPAAGSAVTETGNLPVRDRGNPAAAPPDGTDPAGTPGDPELLSEPPATPRPPVDPRADQNTHGRAKEPDTARPMTSGTLVALPHPSSDPHPPPIHRDAVVDHVSAGAGGVELPSPRLGSEPSPVVSAGDSGLRWHAASPGTATPALPDQIASGLSVALDAPRRRMRVVLQPESLGEVEIRIQEDPRGISVQFTVEREATRDLIEEAWPRLAQTLEARGLPVSRVAIGLAGGELGTGAFGQQPRLHQWGGSAPWRHTRAAAALRVPASAGASATESGHQIDYRV